MAESSGKPVVRLHRLATLVGRICVFGLILTPLIYNPWAYLYGDAFFPPKWFWMGTLTAVGIAALFSRSLIGAPLRFPFDQTWLAALVFFLIHPISLFWAESLPLAIERSVHVGVLTLGLWFGFQAVRTRRLLISMAWVAVGVGAVTALWTLAQDFAAAFWPERAGVVPNLPDWRGYLSAGLGNTNHIGDLLALALLLALVLFGESRRRRAVWASGIALVVLAAGLTVSWSVGSNLGLFAGAATMLVMLLWRRSTRFFGRRKRWWALAVAWGLMLAFFLTDHPANPHRPGIWSQAFGSERWQEGAPTRLVIWSGALEMIRLNPLFGVGAGNFTYEYPDMRSALVTDDPEMAVYVGNWTNAAHNAVLQVWSEFGAVGLLAFVALLALAFHSLLKDLRWGSRHEFIPRMTLTALLVALLTQSMMNFVFQHPSGLATFYLLLLAVIVEKNARRYEEAMPSLVLDKGWALIHVEWRSMRRVKGVGIAFRPSRGVAAGLTVVFALLAVGVASLLFRPVVAETEYGLAATYRRQGQPDLEEKHIRNALAWNPWATGCRSRYVEFLLEQNRPREALIQLAKVRERLNSRELWEREARALQALGREEEAAEAYRKYVETIPEILRPGVRPPS